MPKDLRTPHFIDKDGSIKPYPPDVIEQHRRQSEVPIPSSEPSYHQSLDKQKPKEANDKHLLNGKQIHPDLKEELIGSNEKGSVMSNIQDFVKKSPLPDVLQLDVDDAIKQVKISDVLDMIKDSGSFDISMDVGYGNMHLYQRTYLDETDVAKYDFRQYQSGIRSLNDYISTEKDTSGDLY